MITAIYRYERFDPAVNKELWRRIPGWKLRFTWLKAWLALDHAMNSLRRWQHAKRMENALREVLKYYDEAGEAGENYELDPDNLSKFAADLCKEYSKS